MERCLYCYKGLEEGQVDFHPSCSKAIFGTITPPILPYTRNNLKELAEQLISAQTTITGVQPKLSLDFAEKEVPKRFTIVGLWGRYILKPQTEIYSSLPELEDVTMHLAAIAKIQTVPHTLIRFGDGELCYITKRIDRGNKGEKFPMEDMCQLSERLTEYKYKGSYEQIAKLILKYAYTPKLDAINFWEQALFCWITGNADMHLKNFSLYSFRKGTYHLTPAYDMLSTALVMPADKEELALTLNGKKRKITKEDFVKAFQSSNLEDKIIENIFGKFEKAVPLWKDCIQNCFLNDVMKEQYIELINGRMGKLRD
ncbi:HipA domain-containing protein [Viscerimonas tarda]